MEQRTERHCPSCGTETTFRLAASTLVHISEKTKWRCEACDHAIVRIGEEIEADSMA